MTFIIFDKEVRPNVSKGATLNIQIAGDFLNHRSVIFLRFCLVLFFVLTGPFSGNSILFAQETPGMDSIEIEDPGLPDLEDEVDIDGMLSEEEENEFEFEEFSDEDEILFETGEEGDKELYLGPVRLQKVSGREGFYVFDIKEAVRLEVVVVDLNMKVIKTLIFQEGKGEIDIINLEVGEYFIRFSWASGGVIEKVYRMGKKAGH